MILVVTFKLATHTKFFSLLYVFSILFFSLGVYIAYMWISDVLIIETNKVEHTVSIYFETGETYFLVLLGICAILFVDGAVIFLDFTRGGYASKMRIIMKEAKINDPHEYDDASLSITENLSQIPQNE